MAEYKVCPKCALHGYNTFCRECGKKMVPNDFECPFCKEMIMVSSRFCEYCGRPVQEAAKAYMAKIQKEGGEEVKVE